MELIAVFAPLLGFVIAFLFGKQIGDKGAQFVTCTGLIMAAVASCSLFYSVIIQSQPHVVSLENWITVGDFTVDWALRFDQLSVVMMCVINIVSACVHVYSVGYMSHDPCKARFMSYLSLFTFAMLMLVSADNLVQLFFGWEGVGLASYLLIGFWNHKHSANAAAVKAFVVNRVGDFGLALGIFTIFMVFGTVQFQGVFDQAAQHKDTMFMFLGYEVHALTLACLLLFMGAVGKSAQLGLHTWLPDAMEGPTPVSALIHAATMVTAGVFLVSRFSPVFEYAPTALMVVCIFGAVTALVAATIGLTQFDIKRVIAYSTMSQLGYMFFALGVSAYPAAMFHLTTHAFFKALLFLGAGSVIHAMSDEQDMRKMGGIWHLIPSTYILMWVGSLALAGMPFFAGYYSKDMILETAFADHTWFGTMAYWFGIVAALLTAFYSWRLILMTFHGKPRADEKVMAHVHESPLIMLLPLTVLAAGAILAGSVFYGGFVGSPNAAGHANDILNMTGLVNVWDKMHFWGSSIFVLPENDTVEAAHHVPTWVKLLPIFVASAGIILAYIFYMFAPKMPSVMVKVFKPIHALFYNKWFFDELYDRVFTRNAFRLGQFFWQKGDKAVIDGYGPDGVASVYARFAGVLSRFQTGYVFQYAFVMMIGLIGLVSWFVFRATMGQ
ncbi:NADH-quinone oxidoreductase subunit L [Micavibrio aeruginosavorus]|uniref:NADH-ubiquinone oxidoreductase chain 5 n=1 Tax=Micavibrio aeruginosavorus EPB TaxID=349215 RepID=M4VFF9_9BACT|nr:NADH-quinone oxidoreductase subunit L [Micavibrio aeruginosavorus]AGH98097.1 NADH-ubiquinone oxidoreductase chain L [Micavibrio aeruginosavorus EPB]